MPDLPVTIRPAIHSDIDLLTTLLQILFSIEEDFTVYEPLQKKGLRMMLDNNLACVLVAEVNDQVIGMCSGQLTVSTAEGGPALLVEDVIVHEDYREQGVGKRLMQEIAEWGKTQDVSRFQLLADRNNAPALEFYKRLGWQTTELICLRKLTV
jgi:ribosomal protein S18 acetylase RimI-like enzyme